MNERLKKKRKEKKRTNCCKNELFFVDSESCVVKNDLPACENATGRCKPEELTAADAVDSELSC